MYSAGDSSRKFDFREHKYRLSNGATLAYSFVFVYLLWLSAVTSVTSRADTSETAGDELATHIGSGER